MFDLRVMIAAVTFVACAAIGITGGLFSAITGISIGALIAYLILNG